MAEKQSIGIGSQGPDVKEIQERLNTLGFFLGPVDGIFGAATMSAVQKFQESEQIRPTGKVDEMTFKRLLAARPTPKGDEVRQKKQAASTHASDEKKRVAILPEEFVKAVRAFEFDLRRRERELGVDLELNHDSGYDLVIRSTQPPQKDLRSDDALPLPLLVSYEEEWSRARREFIEFAKDRTYLIASVIWITRDHPTVYFCVAGYGSFIELQGLDMLRGLHDAIAKQWPLLLPRLITKPLVSPEAKPQPTSYLPPIAGFKADDLQRQDRLGIEKEVRALASVVAARDVYPPLSIGLFGDWGVGKSFFIKEMIRWVELYAETAEEKEAQRVERGYTVEPAYWSDIAQIKFNAWHFVDSNLWASLVAALFDGLASHLTRRSKSAEEIGREELLKEIELAHKEVAELERKRKQIEEERKGEEVKLDKIRSRLREEEESLAGIDLKKAASLALSEIRHSNKGLDDALKALGIDDAVESADLFQKRVNELATSWGRTRAQFFSVVTGGNTRSRLLLLAAILVAGPIVGFVVQHLFSSGSMGEFLGVLGRIVTWASGILATGAVWLKKANEGIQKISNVYTQFAQVKSQHVEILEKERSIQEKKIGDLKQSEEEQTKRLEKVNSELSELEEKVEDLKVGRRLFRFIESRVSSPDYKGQLGIIAMIRRDLEFLTDLLTTNSDEKRNAWKNPPPAQQSQNAQAMDKERLQKAQRVANIDRIVLYIDDLDRCPPGRVVEVLQAVHLLLAFKLFVVVVAVDSRWLLRSLEKGYPDFLTIDRDIAKLGVSMTRRASTPQNYLEKIFQIPFSIRPMDRTGFTALVKDLTTVDHSPAGTGIPVPPTSRTSVPSIVGPTTMSTSTVPSSTMVPSPIQNVPPSQNVTSEPVQITEERKIDPNPPSLEIGESEVGFMCSLHKLIGTPRAVNRYVNTYRLIKATVSAEEAPAFYGPANGEYRAVLVLLALLIGVPAQAPRLFRRLDNSPDEASWDQFVKEFKPRKRAGDFPKGIAPDIKMKGVDPETADALAELADINDAELPRWDLIHATLSSLSEFSGETLKPFRKWLRRTGRYAFQPIRFDALDTDEHG